MKTWISTLTMMLLFSACSRQQTENGSKSAVIESHTLSIAVTILPQRYFLKQLLGDAIDVMVMVPPGSSPELYAPSPRQMKTLAQTELYVRVGHISIETAWLEKFASTNPTLQIVNPTQNIEFLTALAHKHDDSTSEEHTIIHGIDPHIWLSPLLMSHYCQNLAIILTEKYPDKTQQINENLTRLTAEIDKLDKNIRLLLEPYQGKGFMVFHPAWSYFARDYGLTQWAIEDQGKSPSPQHLKEMSDLAQSKGIKVLFIQNQFERRSAEAISSALDIQVVELDPLMEDWPAMMMHTAQAIASSFEET